MITGEVVDSPMARALTRRQALRAGVSGAVVGLGGCLSRFQGDDTVSITVDVINNTQDPLQPIVDVVGRSDEVGPQDDSGRHRLIPNGARELRLDVPRAEYVLEVVIEIPRPIRREADWTVTDEECTHRSWVVFGGADDERTADLVVGNCTQA